MTSESEQQKQTTRCFKKAYCTFKRPATDNRGRDIYICPLTTECKYHRSPRSYQRQKWSEEHIERIRRNRREAYTRKRDLWNAEYDQVLESIKSARAQFPEAIPYHCNGTSELVEITIF